MPHRVASNTPSPAGSDARSRSLLLIGIFAAGTGLFLPTLSFEFLSWDDPRYILVNSRVHALTYANLRAIFTEPYFHNYLPLHLLSYLVDYTLWGAKAFGFHLHSLLLHGLNGVLVCLALARLGSPWPVAGAAALLFAVHPSHVESVAWLSSRKDLLSLSFSLLAVIAYRTSLQGERAAARSYALSLLCYSAAILSKAVVVLLPCVLLLVDRLVRGPEDSAAPPAQRRPPWATFLGKTPFFAVALLVSLANYSAQAKGTALSPGRPVEYLLVKGYALWRYFLVLCGAASGQPLYDQPDFGRLTPASLAALGGLCLGLLALAAVALALVRRSHTVLLGTGWMVAMLAPALIFPLVTYMADRYLYAPSVGFVWLVAAGIEKLSGRAGTGAVRYLVRGGLLGACVAVFVLRTALYLPVWMDSEALWSHTVKVSGSGLARNSLAAVRIRQGRFEEAESLLRDPAAAPDADTHRMLGVLLDRTGRFQDAILEYEKGIAICRRGPGCSPEMLGTLHFNSGVTYWHQRDYRASARAYEEAYRAAPELTDARVWAEKARRLAP